MTAAAREALANLDGKTVDRCLAASEPVIIKVDGNDTQISAEDVVITKSFGEDWAGVADGDTVVLLDRRLNPGLKNEGLARDIVRNMKNLRKGAGLDIADRINLSLVAESDSLKAAIDQCGDYICDETLAVELGSSSLQDNASGVEMKIDGHTRGHASSTRSRLPMLPEAVRVAQATSQYC